MKIKTVYIDDDDTELAKYKRKFEDDAWAKDKFEVATLGTQKKVGDLINEVETENPHLILVDFDLAKPKNEVVLGISGTSLSTELREKFPEVPIVLFTRKSVFKIERYPPSILSSLDEIIYKTDILTNASEIFLLLYELGNGFKGLHNVTSKTWKDLLELLNVPEDEHDNLKMANPPLTSGGKWSVSESANWIRKVLIEYPGLLYDPIHSATFLGISRDAFLSKPVQEFFSEAKYSGVFRPPEGRWWKSKLQELAESIMNEKELDLLTCEGFSSAWERNKAIEIEKSKCVFSGESPAEWVCYILKKPVKIEYSLLYKPDTRPPVMDEARVSFEAIRTSNEVMDELFDPLGQEMLKEIRTMEKNRRNNIGN